MANILNNGGAILKLSEIKDVKRITGLKTSNYIIAGIETRSTDSIPVTGATIVSSKRWSDTSTSQANYRYHLVVMKPTAETVTVNCFSGVCVVI